MFYNAYSELNDDLFGIQVKSSGHILAKQDRRISRPKGREDWLLFYVERGCERFWIDGEECDLTDGGFLFFRPGEPQEHVCVSQEGGEYYYIHFFAPHGFDLFGLESARVYPAKPSHEIGELFESVITELQGKHPFYERIVTARFFEIVARLQRRAERLRPASPHAECINRALQLLNREFERELTLDELAASATMSKYHFLRCFKSVVGTSPLEYRNALRIEQAKVLLEDLTLPVAQVGMTVGFSSGAYFSDAFKRAVGCSPRAYRRALSEK